MFLHIKYRIPGGNGAGNGSYGRPVRGSGTGMAFQIPLLEVGAVRR